MKYAVIPQIYTIVAFGASIALRHSLNGMPIGSWAEGMPIYLIHPLFTLHFSLWVTTTIVWLTAFVFSLWSIRKRTLKLTEVLGQNVHVIALASFTVIIALSGWVGYGYYIIHFGNDICMRAHTSGRDLLWLFRVTKVGKSYVIKCYRTKQCGWTVGPMTVP